MDNIILHNRIHLRKAKGSRIRKSEGVKESRIRGVRKAKGSRIRGFKDSSGEKAEDWRVGRLANHLHFHTSNLLNPPAFYSSTHPNV
ncbi:MAG TPA: hypothetical protein PLF87_08190 [Syntrophorhabdaceae bacterium]|nr:hypothetical protein [Syntrophorhabdaceae bacterium]HPL41243.1 hypothetical protein [Syntrophorhabdaceae bacterium]HQM77175.1 hypothetical protein [Syntrophorhabdaceae bacterium]